MLSCIPLSRNKRMGRKVISIRDYENGYGISKVLPIEKLQGEGKS